MFDEYLSDYWVGYHDWVAVLVSGPGSWVWLFLSHTFGASAALARWVEAHDYTSGIFSNFYGSR